MSDDQIVQFGTNVLSEIEEKRKIPLPIQREVRKRCGFGCVICGMPLYEYEHMMEWAVVKRHLPNEITLLCDRHHKEKTNGLLPKEKVFEANEAPYNLRQGVSKPYELYYDGEDAEINIGSNILKCVIDAASDVNQFAALIIDAIPIVGFIFQDGHLLLNLVVYNEFNQLVLHIKNNRLLYSVDLWDVELRGKVLTIRNGSGVILIEIGFEPPKRINILRGSFMLNGVKVNISNGGIEINGLSYKDNFIQASAGIVLGLPRFPGAIGIPHISRYR